MLKAAVRSSNKRAVRVIDQSRGKKGFDCKVIDGVTDKWK